MILNSVAAAVWWSELTLIAQEEMRGQMAHNLDFIPFHGRETACAYSSAQKLLQITTS